MEDETKETPKLFRSRKDRFFGGVCGGVSQYFDIDSNLVRILFVIFTMLWGVGVIIYLAALIIVPENPEEALEPRRQTANSSLFWGILFVAFGAVLLFWQMNLFRFFYFDIPWSTLWAVFLITIGGGLLYTQWKKQTEREKTETEDDVTGSGNANDGRFEIYRSRTDRKIAGICGGLAKYFHVDSSFIRLAWILMTFASKGLGLLLYIIFMFIFPEEPSRQTV